MRKKMKIVFVDMRFSLTRPSDTLSRWERGKGAVTILYFLLTIHLSLCNTTNADRASSPAP